MTFKEFGDWCNDRICDGCWSAKTAIYCIEICYYINDFPFWKREKIWREDFESEIVKDVVEVINKKRKDAGYY